MKYFLSFNYFIEEDSHKKNAGREEPIEWKRTLGKVWWRKTVIRTAIGCIMAVWLLGGCMKNIKPTQLTEQEKQELLDIAMFNRSLGNGGWSLQNRIVSEINLAGLQLENASLNNVHFEFVDLSNSTIISSKFTDTLFNSSKMANATIQRCEFVNCDFSGIDAKKITFKDCIFRGGKAKKWDVNNGQFSKCIFEKFDGTEIRFKSAKLHLCRFTDSAFNRCSFYGTSIDESNFNQCKLESVMFSEIYGRELVFEGGELQNSGFESATYTNLKFYEIVFRKVSFDSFKISGLEICKCPSESSLVFIDCEMQNIRISDDKPAEEIFFVRSKVNNFILENCQIADLEFADTEISGESALRSSTISVLVFEKSNISGLRMENIKLGRTLTLKGVVFKNLHLKGIVYSSGFQINSDNVQYVDSSKFGSETKNR